MGLKDEVAKKYIGRPEIFADLCNQYFFHGEQVIRPENLKPEDPAEGIKLDDSKKVIQRQRDLLKTFELVMSDEETEYWLIGVENQAKVDYAMPARSALDDTLRFMAQVKNIAEENKQSGRANKNFTSGFLKDDWLKPVVTLVLYLGHEPWDGKLSLKDMCKCSDKRILEYVMDYRINLISPLAMKDEEFEQFRTTLGIIMPAIKYAGDRAHIERLFKGNTLPQIMGKTEVDMINAYTKAKISLPEGEEEVTMKWAFDEIRADARAEGVAEGEARGRAEGEARGRAEGRAEGVAEGEARGRAEGEARGEHNKAIEVVRNMKKLGMSLKDIAMCVNLPMSEIQALE